MQEQPADERQEHQARLLAVELDTRGSTVIHCDDDTTRDQVRTAAHRASAILGRPVETKDLHEGIAVWDAQRPAEHQRTDANEANRRLDEAYRRRGPLTGDQPPPPQEPGPR
ncbi:hypothetical protein [Allosalinactinospora lopnorensis]|uniref:hypothetical protein n=1 Tax=Allosalinactinospora lopnorensis TaxID=1352348 RepID=UPI000623DC0A|nr:hypothetical protein [Allosalinactinospora lopnorensis]